MKIGDAVRVRLPNKGHRLARGMVVEMLDGEPAPLVRVAIGLGSYLVAPAAVTVIRKPHERAIVLARVRSIRQAAADLVRDRGNKKQANRSQ